MAGERVRRAKNKVNLAFNVGLDDLMSTLDFKEKWSTFKEEVNRANQKAQKKSSMLSFLRTAVFYATAVATGGLSLGTQLATTAARAAISTGASMVAGSVGDKSYGDIPVPQAPEMRASKFNQTRNLEKQGQLEDSYTELEGDIELAEQNIDTANWVEPLTNAISFYGPALAKGVAEGGGLGIFKGGVNFDFIDTLRLPDGVSMPGAEPGTSFAQNMSGGGFSDMTVASAGSGGMGRQTGTADIPMPASTGDLSSTEIDWNAIEGVLNTMRSDVESIESGTSVAAAPMSQPYGLSGDYDFSDEIADSLT